MQRLYVPVQIDIVELLYTGRNPPNVMSPEVVVEINNLYPVPCYDIGGVTYTAAFLKECAEPLIVRASDGSLAELSMTDKGPTAKAHRIKRTVLPPQKPLRRREY